MEIVSSTLCHIVQQATAPHITTEKQIGNELSDVAVAIYVMSWVNIMTIDAQVLSIARSSRVMLLTVESRLRVVHK